MLNGIVCLVRDILKGFSPEPLPPLQWAVSDRLKAISTSLLEPHYRDQRFKEQPQIVYLAPGYKPVREGHNWVVEKANHKFSNFFMRTFGYDKLREAYDAALGKGFPKNSAAMLEAYLQELFGDQSLQLVQIVAGVNRGDDYPYCVYWYILGEKEVSPENSPTR